MYYGDVHAGTLAIRSGVPHGQDQWGRSCGFYTGSHPGDYTNGSAATFEQARADFGAAWRVFLSTRTEARFPGLAPRAGLDRVGIRVWDAGCKLPTHSAEGRSRCFCGEAIDIPGMPPHVYAAHPSA